jgi:ribose-phosphate pyrophosphokinase
MELLFTLSTLKAAGCKSVRVIIPYLAYGRDLITASTVAEMIETMGADQVVSVDFHQDFIQGYY